MKTTRTFFIAALSVIYLSTFAVNNVRWNDSLKFSPAKKISINDNIIKNRNNKKIFSFENLGNKGQNEQWIDVGLRIAPASTWMINGNMMQDKNISYKASFGFLGGAKLGFNFSEVVAINIEGLYDRFNQRFTSKMDSVSWNKKTQLTYIDIPVILRFTNGWKYYEIGVSFQTLSSVTGKFSSDNAIINNNNIAYTTFTKDQFNKSNTSIIFGWGSAIWGAGGMVFTTGLRFSYGLTDVTGANDKDVSYPSPQYPGFKPDPANPDGLPYKMTKNVSAALMINMEYDLGYFMSSSCRRKHAFVLFSH
jgi:hypothetical protein